MMYADAKEQVRQATDIVELVGKHLELRRAGPRLRRPLPVARRPQAQPASQSRPPDLEVLGLRYRRRRLQLRDEARRLRLPRSPANAGRPGRHPALARSSKRRPRPAAPTTRTRSINAATGPRSSFTSSCCKSDARRGGPAIRRRAEHHAGQRRAVRHRLCAERLDVAARSGAETRRIRRRCSKRSASLGKSERSGNYYDRFKGRVIFPIRDTQGRTIAFGGRDSAAAIADEERGKYVNSPETRLYTKSDTLYALDIVRNHDHQVAAADRRRRLHRRDPLPPARRRATSSPAAARR